MIMVKFTGEELFMTRRRFIKAIALLMVLISATSIINTAPGGFKAEAATTQSEINSLKNQKKDIENRQQQIAAEINSMEYEQKSLLAKKEVLDRQILLMHEDIENTNAQIEQYTRLISEKEADIVTAQQEEDEQLAKFKHRIRAMEEAGSISYLSILFEANSFSDLLARIDFIGEVMAYDEQLYEQLKAAKQATIQAKADLVLAKKEQETKRAELKDKNAELEKQLLEVTALAVEIDNNINAAKEQYQQELDAAKKIQNEINKKLEELKKQQSQVKGTGKLIWPTPSCNIVTSPYGTRIHPIYGDPRKHYGIDIGAKYGANIVAADGGTVIISAYSSSYGNYAVISHGNGMTTLYAHMSQRLVKVGAVVKQNDLIGKVGSTGASTGPHLHFEVTTNGSRVNPLNYFSNYVKGWD